jgi:hypothetical protein
VLTQANPFVGVDLDHCRDPETGAIEKWAREIIAFLWSYTEVTPSGTGFRIFLRATLPPEGRKHGRVELYDDRRFLTVTGWHVPGAPETIQHRQEETRELHAHYFPPTEPRTTTNEHHPPPTVDTPVTSLTAEDRALYIKACTAKDGLRFAGLWNGDTNGYPSPSEADLALCSMLGYWGNGDAARIDRLFRQSGLYRAKWDEQRGGQSYGERTIARALQRLQGGSLDEEPTRNQAGRRARLIRLADVAPQQVTWLWPGHIPRGKLTLLIGDPGMGKSTLALDFIARVTTGTEWPDGSQAPLGNALILSAEDGLADTIRPRLDRLGADPERVQSVQSVIEGDRESGLTLAHDLDVLENAITENDVLLVVIDPLSAYLGKLDSFRDDQVRSIIFGPIAAMAERTGVAVVGILHITKAEERRAITRALGSVAFAAAPRAVFAVGADPDDAGRRVFASVKANLGPKPPTLAFRLRDEGAGLVLEWESSPVAGLDAETVLGGYTNPEDREERRDAKVFLREFLEANGPAKAADVF